MFFLCLFEVTLQLSFGMSRRRLSENPCFGSGVIFMPLISYHRIFRMSSTLSLCTRAGNLRFALTSRKLSHVPKIYGTAQRKTMSQRTCVLHWILVFLIGHKEHDKFL